MAGGLGVQFDYSDGKTTASKSFSFTQDSYLVTYTDDVTSGGTSVPHLIEWRGGFGDMAVHNASGLQHSIRYDINKKKLVEDAAKTAKNGPVNTDGAFSFAGIDDQYFAAAFLPVSGSNVDTTIYDDIGPSAYDKSDQPCPGVAVGGAAQNNYSIYIGPKEVNLLHSVNPRLDGIVDWGWFGVIAKPLFLVLHWMNDQFVHNYLAGRSIFCLRWSSTSRCCLSRLPTSNRCARCRRCSGRLQPSITSTKALACRAIPKLRTNSRR